MKRALIAILACLFSATVTAASEQARQPEEPANQLSDWTLSDITVLKRWIEAAPQDALPVISTARLDEAVAAGDPSAINEEATHAALLLARMHLLGEGARAERAGWNIVDSDADLALEPMLENAVANGAIDTFFALMRPTHEEYSALRAAFARETDAEKLKAIARNMERWRWMPKSLGEDYVLVNAASFEARLWRGGELAQTWRVIVGKKSTPTPVFNTQVEGVILNPWWEIPASIVRESVGALVRRNPSLARQRGYVWADGRYRQKPGPGNALGLMKLVMPNRYSVYMHDTPNKQLFDEDIRSFSHGCIRTHDAIGYAATLLEGTKSREEIDAILASGKTTTVKLARPIPIYVAYFTAAAGDDGEINFLADIYERDKRIQPVAIDRPAQTSRQDLNSPRVERKAQLTCALTDDLGSIG